MIKLEDEYRRLFAEEPNNSKLNDPHALQLNVFENAHTFKYEPETEDEAKVPKLFLRSRVNQTSGPNICDQATFVKNWKALTVGILDGLNWNNVFVAGGAVLACLSLDQSRYRTSDIDIFIHGITSEAAANEKLKEIHALVSKNTKHQGEVIRTARAVTLINPYPYRHVQIILRLYQSPSEVLLGFDIDSCTVGFDGKNVWCMDRFRRALNKRYNLVNMSRRSITYEQRLYKYGKRGFAAAVPDLDKARVDAVIFDRKRSDLQGLAKLLHYDHEDLYSNTKYQVRQNIVSFATVCASVL